MTGYYEFEKDHESPTTAAQSVVGMGVLVGGFIGSLFAIACCCLIAFLSVK